MSLLEVEELSCRFGGLWAVRGVSFHLAEGEILALIGPNGAGKTTCLDLIAGRLRPTAGRVRFAGSAITGLPPEHIARRGLLRTFQIPRPLRGLTVEENAMVGPLARGLSFGAARRAARAAVAQAGLADRCGRPAHTLTLLERKRLELARCLALQPRLLLLDEVMAGLRPGEIDEMVELLRQVRIAGTTLLLVEHVMRVVMALADRVLVLHQGELIAEGPPAVVTRDPRVIESYLGVRAEA